ncbi:hypothetical protein Tco_0312540 [Tanacetum coccineum]
MKIFPLSLADDAKQWWINEGEGKITIWEELVEKFFCKFYPDSYDEEEEILDKGDNWGIDPLEFISRTGVGSGLTSGAPRPSRGPGAPLSPVHWASFAASGPRPGHPAVAPPRGHCSPGGPPPFANMRDPPVPGGRRRAGGTRCSSSRDPSHRRPPAALLPPTALARVARVSRRPASRRRGRSLLARLSFFARCSGAAGPPVLVLPRRLPPCLSFCVPLSLLTPVLPGAYAAPCPPPQSGRAATRCAAGARLLVLPVPSSPRVTAPLPLRPSSRVLTCPPTLSSSFSCLPPSRPCTPRSPLLLASVLGCPSPPCSLSLSSPTP